MVQHAGREGGNSKPVSRPRTSRGLLIHMMFSCTTCTAFDCVSDGGAEPAGGDQLSTAAVLPDGDHRAQTHRERSGG